MVPEGWNRALLGKVAKVSGGNGFPTHYQGRREGPLMFVKVSDMNLRGNEFAVKRTNNYLDRDTAAKIGARTFPGNTIVFPKVGAALFTNKRRILERSSLIDNNIMGIVPLNVDHLFLYYFLLTVDLGKLVQPGAVPSVNQKMVGAIEVPLPPLPEQKKIAEILSSVDAAIQAKEAKIEQIKRVKQGLLQDLLTRGIGHTRFKKTEIGEIPEGWNRALLGKVAKVSGGNGFPTQYQGRREGLLMFIKVSDMNLRGNEFAVRRTNNYLDRETAAKIGARTFPRNTIVFPKVGAALFTNKRRILERSSLIDNNIMGIIPLNVDHLFLYYFLLTVDLGKLVQQGAVPSVNQKMVSAIEVPLPPLPEQKKISEMLSTVDTAIQTKEANVEQIRRVKQGLMQDLLTGRVRVGGLL